MGNRGGIIKAARKKTSTIMLDAEADGVEPFEGTGYDARCFPGQYERRIIKGVGHNFPWKHLVNLPGL